MRARASTVLDMLHCEVTERELPLIHLCAPYLVSTREEQKEAGERLRSQCAAYYALRSLQNWGLTHHDPWL